LLVPAAGQGQAGGEHPFAQMPEDVLVKLGELSMGLPVLGYTPLLYVVGEIESHRVVLVGTWPDAVRRINPWWRVEGGWIGGRTELDEAVVGTSLARQLRLSVGARLALTVTGRTRAFRVVGILSSGGSEDEQVVVTLRAAQELAGRAGRLRTSGERRRMADRRRNHPESGLWVRREPASLVMAEERRRPSLVAAWPHRGVTWWRPPLRSCGRRDRRLAADR
jgi:hypothetical protein